MFSTITTAPSTTIPKSSAPSDSRLAGMSLEIETDRGEQQRKWNRQRDDKRSADVAEEQKEDDHDQNDAFRQVVQHRMSRVLHKIAAIDERDDLDARGQNVVVEFVHLLVDPYERVVRIGAFAQEDRCRHHIVIVNDLAVFTADRPPELTQTNLRALRHDGDILHAERRPSLV